MLSVEVSLLDDLLLWWPLAVFLEMFPASLGLVFLVVVVSWAFFWLLFFLLPNRVVIFIIGLSGRLSVFSDDDVAIGFRLLPSVSSCFFWVSSTFPVRELSSFSSFWGCFGGVVTASDGIFRASSDSPLEAAL